MPRRNWILLSFVMLFLISSSFTSVPIFDESIRYGKNHQTADFVAARVLFDESHTANGSSLWVPGNASLFSWMLGVNGYNSSTNFDQELDSGILGGFDILVIFFPMIPLTTAEINAVHSFVQNGGGLLLVGVNGADNGWQFSSANLNPISQTYGITFGIDAIWSSTNDFVLHQITQNITGLMFDGEQLGGCSLTVENPAQSIVNADGKSVVAIAESGAGRIVAVGSPAPFYMYRRGGGGYGASHFQFGLNIIDWLAGNSFREVNVPEIATIIVGDGPNINQTELGEYRAFTGSYHLHTTYSDGQNTVEEMVEAGLKIGLDFMVFTDHSHDKPLVKEGVKGGLAAQHFVKTYGFDITIMPGAELSSVRHTTGFPLKENIFTADQQEAVDGIHAQGGIATLAHPTITPNYAEVYEDFDKYGFDAIEVDNSGFFYGDGEDGFFKNFWGAADAHSVSAVGKILNIVFVKKPTGPNGRISPSDLIDAILNKRVVIFDRLNKMAYGQRIWVERFLELQNEAENAITAGDGVIENLQNQGAKVGLSEKYLAEAQVALNWENPGRALRLAQNATSATALGIDLQLESENIVEPTSSFSIIITLANNHSYIFEINATVFAFSALNFDQNVFNLVVQPKDSETLNITGESSLRGYSTYWLNIVSFNTTEFLNPILFRLRAPIDNVSWVIESDGNGYSATIKWWVDKSARTVTSTVFLVYDDGTGAKKVAMQEELSWYEIEIGPYTTSTNVTFYIEIIDVDGNLYTLKTRTIVVGQIGRPGMPAESLWIAGIGGGIIAIVAIVVVLLKRRK